jgi:thiol-disulfide isomerase/thioredoxin
MKALRTAARVLLGAASSVVFPAVLLAAGQDPAGAGKTGQAAPDAASGKAYSSLADLDADYAQQAKALEQRRLADLTALAQRVTGLEAERVYRAAFDLAVARGLYAGAEPAARAYLARETGEPENHALAATIAVVARAQGGQFDESLAELKQFLQHRASANIPDERRLPGAMVCAVGEAYLQHLIRGGRFDIAREVCRLGAAIDHPDKAVAHHFAQRLHRFEMVGKPAPPIDGTDVDGKPVRLADLKGKVVLIDFWASWCPPSAAAFPHLRELQLAHRAEGFTVLGVNVDGLSQDPEGKPADPKEVLATVRWFLLQHRSSWPEVVGDGASTAAKDYGVSAVPSNFLLARDGTIIDIELHGRDLERAVVQALKGATAAGQR